MVLHQIYELKPMQIRRNLLSKTVDIRRTKSFVPSTHRRKSSNYSGHYGDHVILFYLSLFFFSVPQKHIFSISVFISTLSLLFIYFSYVLLHHYRGACVRACVCFISCLCLNSNPSSHHTFPAWKWFMNTISCQCSRLSCFCGFFRRNFFLLFLSVGWNVVYLENLPLIFPSIFYVYLFIRKRCSVLWFEINSNLLLTLLSTVSEFFLSSLSSYSLPSVIISQNVYKEKHT